MGYEGNRINNMRICMGVTQPVIPHTGSLRTGFPVKMDSNPQYLKLKDSL